MSIRTLAAAIVAAVSATDPVRAGYEAPCHIDGGQSLDGRFTVTASLVVDPKAGTKGGPPAPNPAHGPFQWAFTWKDNRSGETRTFPARGVQRGQVYAHLFVAPDGETFALWNHVTLWHPEQSHGRGADVLKGDKPGAVPADKRTHEALSRRVIVYRKDGTVLKELGVNDFLAPEEWDSVLIVFNRAHWIAEHPPLWFKSCARQGQAFYRISPDYTVLEFRLVAKGGKPGRTVRVDLTAGAVLPADFKTDDKNKIPVRPFVGPDKLPTGSPAEKEGYVPSLDPVRTEGRYTIASAAGAAGDAKPTAAETKIAGTAPALQLVKDGFTKLDTPAWLPAEKCLLFTDLDGKKLFRLDAPDKVTVVREEACRGKVGPDGRFFGIIGERLTSWRPGEEPQVIVEKAAGGRDLSLNDLAVSPKGFLYFTTLKNPDKGRLSIVDVAKKTVTVAWDGESDSDLWNPNGVAVSPDGKFLYVGLSSYKDRKKSGVRRFPIREDGSLDIAAGKAAMWAAVPAPDGIAADRDGNVYVTAGAAVVVCTPDGRKSAAIKIPKGSGTNLAFGGEDGRTLYVTTNNALYTGRVEASAAGK